MFNETSIFYKAFWNKTETQTRKKKQAWETLLYVFHFLQFSIKCVVDSYTKILLTTYTICSPVDYIISSYTSVKMFFLPEAVASSPPNSSCCSAPQHETCTHVLMLSTCSAHYNELPAHESRPVCLKHNSVYSKLYMSTEFKLNTSLHWHCREIVLLIIRQGRVVYQKLVSRFIWISDISAVHTALVRSSGKPKTSVFYCGIVQCYPKADQVGWFRVKECCILMRSY